jgi:hypothetical protein
MSERTFETVVGAYAPEIQELARAARALLFEQLPDCEEHVDTRGPYLSYGYGPGYKGIVCSLIVSKTGVKLGVAFADVPDPKGLLEGEGKVFRHIQLKTPADLRRPGVKPIVKAALAAWRRKNAG